MTTELDRYVREFELEYQRAEEEHSRLVTLFTDVCWFHQEVKCRDWKRPWRPTVRGTMVVLDTPRVRQLEHGELHEVQDYFIGEIDDAPLVPPEIVLKEVRDAAAYVKECKRNVSAPYDWAPGGSAYNALCRSTLVGRTFSSGVVDNE